uniref:hypothetical protein n=1 Tax=Flavobacterium sp. TaxID=239 RepID=UPI004047F94A
PAKPFVGAVPPVVPDALFLLMVEMAEMLVITLVEVVALVLETLLETMHLEQLEAPHQQMALLAPMVLMLTELEIPEMWEQEEQEVEQETILIEMVVLEAMAK